MKTDTIKLNVRPLWRIGKGHNPHRSGAGVHGDRRTRRVRTRGAASRRAVDGE
jgi:hypothetical protein